MGKIAMISVDKDSKQKPFILSDDTIKDKLLTIMGDAEPGNKIKDLYNNDEVRDALHKLYHSKCAYCEGSIDTAQFSSRIDHYRPKNKIGKGQKQIPNHKGYFWLGYEWTNLLPTCEQCNGCKSNKFPLTDESTRISDNLEREGFLQNGTFVFENFKVEKLEREERLLLNPEIDIVEEHLWFSPLGDVKGLTPKGLKTIEVYDLNRKELVLARLNEINKLTSKLIAMLVVLEDENTALEKMLNHFFQNEMAYDSTKKYSRFRYFIYEFFQPFILERLTNLGLASHAKLLAYYFDKYKAKKVVS